MVMKISDKILKVDNDVSINKYDNSCAFQWS